MVLTALANFNQTDNWQQAKADYMDKMLDFADSKINGLKSHILFIEAGSPATISLSPENKCSLLGGSDTNRGANRIANKAPIEGLYFAGHWTTPGGGVYGVSYSGVQTAQKILGLTRQDELWALCADGEGNA
ncbi:MAG: hypothetical protein H0A75_00750 [Candidatus Methanofishera endochildressiae]|uniref:Amine oxidase domain-containing protein n=1 Tax=Candidatus Methanofishera endochildressiae TaxID=2738884 RepID=A0A7Z0SD29_9GAMM|nr:hypothetical protein [Candidatus Methanofishera endochildressiae]